MVASPVQPIMLACPRCGTRYQLPAEAIGPRGRKVTCAHCRETWHAEGAAGIPLPPDPDQLFDEVAESALDRAFADAEREAEADAAPELPADLRAEEKQQTGEEIQKAITPRPPAAAERQAGRRVSEAFVRRHAALGRHLPIAKMRRALRLAALSLLLVLVASAVALRTEIVRQFPALADAYATFGLSVNVVGLEFRDIRTLSLTRGGSEIIRVDARIYSVAARRVRVPPVIVTLLDVEGRPLYEWSVRPDVRDLEHGELLDVSTELSAPPPGARRVRLTFATADRGVADATIPSSEASI